MSELRHVSVIYINTSPERVWEGLTSAEFTRAYFHETAVVSDWTPGSEVTYFNPDGSVAVRGEVLEAVLSLLSSPSA